MKKIETIYLTNKVLIDRLLLKNDYQQTYADFLVAVETLGLPFLYEIYHLISSNWENADGKGWSKFKNIFGKVTGVVNKVNQGSNIANSFLNPPEKTDQPNPEPEKKQWKPNLLLWGGIGAAIIIILLIIVLFKNRS